MPLAQGVYPIKLHANCIVHLCGILSTQHVPLWALYMLLTYDCLLLLATQDKSCIAAWPFEGI